MSKIKFLVKMAFLPLLFVGNSCVKDVDFDQASEIVIPPTVAMDLVYFTLAPSHFHEDVPAGPLVAKDVVRLEFLDDDYIQNSLVQANFNFIYTNTFPQPFTNTITFLSENNAVKYKIVFDIPAGSVNAPSTVDYTEIIDIDEIDAVRETIKMAIEIEMHPNSEAIEGELQLKSKAFYKFEFK